MARHMSAWTRRAVALVLLFLPSCGGGGSSPTSPGQPSAGPSSSTGFRSVLISDLTFSLQPGAATYKNVDLPPVGTLDATIDWAGNNDIKVYVTDNTCTGFNDLRAGRCNMITKADGTAKPQKVSFATQAGRIYSFWIYNNGTSAENGSMEVGITTAQPLPPAAEPTPPPPGSDPRAGLAAGPVVRYTIKVRTIDTGGFNYRDPQEDQEGNWIVHPGEFVVFDSTQKNAEGLQCKWVDNPEWFWNDPSGSWNVKGSSQPFLLRVDIKKKGLVEVSAQIDGVRSNTLRVLSAAR
jgi:hypothetical protein